MKVEQIKTDILIPYEKNTKKHDERQIKNVAKSIEQYGFVQPIVIDKDNVVVIGHCRLLAAKQLKLKEVPCVRVEDLTEEQVRKLRIVDNKSNESEWDLDFLADELGDLDFSDFEFDFSNIQEELVDEDDKDDEGASAIEKLPESKIYGFSISAFGTNSEIFLQTIIPNDDVEKIIAKCNEIGADAVVERIRSVLYENI